MELQGLRTIAVGGASGMAKATAERIVAGGGQVAVLDRPSSDGAEVASALGGSFFPCDVTDFEGTELAIADAVATLGGVDAVVNTRVAVSPHGPSPATGRSRSRRSARSSTST